MQLSVAIEDFKEECIGFCSRAENTVISGGGFYRVMYYNKDVTMLGTHVLFDVDMTVEDYGTGRLDVHDALATITPKVTDVVAGLTNTIHKKWCGLYGDKPLAGAVTPHSVEPAILKALLQARTALAVRTDNPRGTHSDAGMASAAAAASSSSVATEKESSPTLSAHTDTSVTIKMSFVFKCAGIYDTDVDSGVSFRLNSVTRR